MLDWNKKIHIKDLWKPISDKFKKKKKRYYREWMACHGWGVMMYYDSTWAYSKREASRDEPVSSYTHWSIAEKSRLGYYDSITLIKDEHIELGDEELSKIYGVKEE